MRHDPAAPPPVVLECEDLAFDYDTHKDAFGLRDVSLRLRAGRALGVIGLNGAGKSTLCKVLSAAELPGAAGGDWRPLRGRVAWRPRGGGAAVDPHARWRASGHWLAAAAAAAAAAADGRWAAAAAALALAGWWAARRRRRRSRAAVDSSSSAHDHAAHGLEDAWPLARAVCGHLAGLDAAARAALAERLLDWAGFRRYGDDGAVAADAAACVADAALTCGALSGGQRQLVYLLRCLAPCFAPGARGAPDVLVLDEAFTGLDARVKPRALRLVREARAGARVALLVVSQNLHELAALCDECACVAAGRLVDRGPAPDFLRPARPGAHAAAAFYLDAYWALERDMRAAAGPALPPEALARAAGAELRRQIAGLPALRRWGPPWDPRAPARGAAVEVGGLEAQRRFNGRRGRVLGAGAGRYRVRLADGQVLGVRRCHLNPLRP